MRENLKLAKAIAKRAGIKCSIKLDDEMLHFDEWLTIRSEERTILKERGIFRKRRKNVPIYVVEIAKPINNYPHEPDDVDIVEIGYHQRIEDAIFKALITYFTNRLNCVIESVSMEREYRKDYPSNDGE